MMKYDREHIVRMLFDMVRQHLEEEDGFYHDGFIGSDAEALDFLIDEGVMIAGVERLHGHTSAKVK